MYCSQCGCQLPNSSNFCSSCGYKINSVVCNAQKGNTSGSLLPVSRGNLILYLSWWSLAALIFLIFIWVDNESILPALFVLPVYVGIPLIAYTIFRNKNKQPSDKRGIPKDDSSLNTSYKLEPMPDEMPLMAFANEFGKMQVCKAADKNGNIHSKCIFTKMTEVNFSDSIGELTASEISVNKLNLVVRKNSNGQYELSLVNGGNIK